MRSVTQARPASCRSIDGARPEFGEFKFRSALFLGVAGAALLAGAAASVAGDVSWANPSSVEMLWSEADNWSSGSAPVPGDKVTIGTGNAGLYTNVTVDTVNLDAGILWINRNGVLNADTVNVTGGRLVLSKGNSVTTTNPGPQGIANISTLLNITGGTIERYGLFKLGDNGLVTQSGGEVWNPIEIHTPSYVQTGGLMDGLVTATTYVVSGDTADGAEASQMRGTVTLGDTFTMGDGALVNGRVVGDSSTRVLQTGGDMTGSVTTGAYEASGGTFTGTANFTELFALSGDASLGWIDIFGDGDAVMTQSGGTMGAWVEGLETYTMSGGTISEAARVLTNVFVQSGGTIDSPSEGNDWRATVGFATRYELSGEAIIGLADVVGASDATMMQSGGTMGGEVSSQTGDWTIGKYSQTGGRMTGQVTTRTYEASGGSITGMVNFADHFELSGGEIAFVDIWGGLDATMTQTGGTMGGWVHAAGGDGYIEKYTQTGGDMTAYVTTRNYEMSGGTIGDWIDVSELFELKDGVVTSSGGLSGWGTGSVAQSGGTMDGSAIDIIDYAQSGGTMSGYVASEGYALSGGTMSGDVDVGRFTQSGGAIEGRVSTNVFELADGTGAGIENVAIGEELVLSGGSLSRQGLVAPVFTQTGGAFTGSITVAAYNLLGATGTTAGVITASDAFNLAPDSGSATVGAQLRGGGTLYKRGQSTVTITNGANDFSGGVAIEGGILEIVDDALTDGAAVNVEPGAALQLTTNNDTLFTGSLTGKEGDLIKEGAATATLAGTVDMGDLWLNAGRLNIGTGTSTNEATFETAEIAKDATLYIASGATLTIRVPKHILNNGTLINDGTVHDDLDNHGTFTNNKNYNADVATNTGTIDNNKPGYWTGDIESNAGEIRNAVDATWDGSVDANIGIVSNRGIWKGDVNGNGTANYWPRWTYGLVYNDKDAIWTGDVVDNNGSVRNVAGTWNGDVLDNHNTVMNDNSSDELDLGYWNGNVVANHGIVFNGGGGIWTGDVLSNNGRVLSGRAAQHSVATDNSQWHGDVVGNVGSIDSYAFWYGEVKGNSGIVANSGWWEGDVQAGNTGTIYNAQDNFGVPVYDTIRPTWQGVVVGNAGTILNIGADWTGDVSANTGQISNRAGVYNGFLLGGSTWTGDVKTNAGTISNGEGSSWSGDVVSNVGTIETAGEWSGDSFNSAGTVRARGTINAVVDNSGLFTVTGSLSGITSFSNSGTLSFFGNGATQTLTVGGIVFDADSVLELDIDGAGGRDRIVATTATLAGAAKVSAAGFVGSADYTSPYSIIVANTISGSFDSVTTDLAFFDAAIDVNGGHTEAILTLTRNDIVFPAVGESDNQKSVAASIALLDPDNPIYKAILGLTEAQAQEAFDDLSGEAFASEGAVALNTANLIGGIALDRLRQLFGAVDADGAASGYAATLQSDAEAAGEAGLWTQFYGDVGIVDASADLAGLTYGTGGAAIGLDTRLDAWRFGVLAHAGITAIAVDARNSVIRSADYGVGVYAGREWGDTRLALGGIYSRHDAYSERNVTIPGFAETLTAEYAGDTGQAFGEVTHEFDLGAVSLIPFAGLAYVSTRTDGFTETGGAAALTRSPDAMSAVFTTLGTSIDGEFIVGDGMLLTATGTLGWRHAFADAPAATNSLAGGSSFGVTGMPVVSDMFMLGAGFNLDVSPTAMLDISYDGQFGGTTQVHALQGTWSSKF